MLNLDLKKDIKTSIEYHNHLIFVQLVSLNQNKILMINKSSDDPD